MAFPASANLQSEGLRTALNTARRLKSLCQSRITQMAAGDVSAEVVTGLRDDMINADAVFGDVAGISGIVEYAQSQFDDDQLDIAAEFTAMRTAVQAVRSNIESTFFADGDGYLLAWKFNPSGSGLTVRNFTSVQTSTLRTLLAAVVSAID